MMLYYRLNDPTPESGCTVKCLCYDLASTDCQWYADEFPNSSS